MPQSCSGSSDSQPRPLAQTLFLGASVIGYSVNLGWGGQSSTLTVELVGDTGHAGCTDSRGQSIQPYSNDWNTNYDDNHYVRCLDTPDSDSCYVDQIGRVYSSDNDNPKPNRRDVPGKVYYVWTPYEGIVSRYWFKNDPGFFGDMTTIDINGQDTQTSRPVYTSYDIIGIPVFFMLDKFHFAGIVKSWEKNIRQGDGVTYTVIIESPESLLENSWMILSGYAGSIFSKLSDSRYGIPLPHILPTSLASNILTNHGTINQGNIPNIFNVYGFLESFGNNGFGGSRLNDTGISYTSAINALAVLTSSLGSGNDPTIDLAILNKRDFSPFGRIIGKTIQENGSLERTTNNLGFGTIPSFMDLDNKERSSFVLDLSEFPALPDDYRISGNVISVMDFVRSLASVSGKDFFTTLVPMTHDGKALNVIKFKVIDRTITPSLNQVAATVEKLRQNKIGATINNIGREASPSATIRTMYIGGKQERLYQAKNFRLGFKQTAYIYNPATDQLVNYNILASAIRTSDPNLAGLLNAPSAGKVKIPVFFSTRNPNTISSWINQSPEADRPYLELIQSVWNTAETINERLNSATFNAADTAFQDNEVGGTDTPRYGNYGGVQFFRGYNADPITGKRYIPLFMDVICPFFGYELEDNIELSTDSASNTFRRIRPVWLDTWTGQLAIVMRSQDLPYITAGTSSIHRTSRLSGFNNQTFIITETEIRAAMAGFDSYLTYCFAKSMPTKPQIYMMLVASYYYANPQLANYGGWYRQSGNFDGAAAVPWLAPGFVFAQQVNQANNQGDAGRATPSSNNNITWDYMIDNNFIKDLMVLANFVAEIGNKYYGKKYMVRLGNVSSYKDSGSPSLFINAASLVGSTYATSETPNAAPVFAGSGKIYYALEPCESAWEEQGNVIDDCLLVGGEAFYGICNDDGKIPPLLGYNASDNYDYESKRLCGLATIVGAMSLTKKSQLRLLAGDILSRNLGWVQGIPRQLGLTSQHQMTMRRWLDSAGLTAASANDILQIDNNTMSLKLWQASVRGDCSWDKFRYPGLNLGSLDKNDFIVVNTTTPRKDAFGTVITAGQPSLNWIPPILNPDLSLTPVQNPYGMAKKLFLKAEVEGMAFMDPNNLKDTRAIMSCQGITINPPSLSFRVDPTRTVLSNAALEDLIVYLKVTSGANPLLPYDQSYVNSLLFQIRGYDIYNEIKMSADGNLALNANKPVAMPNMGYSTNVSKDHVMLAPKAAHPYYAGVPLRSNIYTYGPWVNYPSMLNSNLFRDSLIAERDSYREELNYYNNRLNELNSTNRISPQRNYEQSRKELDQKIRQLQNRLEKYNTGLTKFDGDIKEPIENLIAGTKVEVDNDLVPWNYGSMTLLDEAVLILMNSNTDLQTILESAQVNIPSGPIFGLGGEFLFTPGRRPPGGIIWSGERYRVFNDRLVYNDIKTSTPDSSAFDNIPLPGDIVYLPQSSDQIIDSTITYLITRLESVDRTGIAPIVSNISIRFDSGGYNTTYSFKTYAKKLGLYAKEASDRLKKAAEFNIKLNRSIFSLGAKFVSGKFVTSQESLSRPTETFTAKGLNTKLYGSSPTEVLVGNAQGFLPSVGAMNTQLNMNSLTFDSAGNSMRFRGTSSAANISIYGKDPGDIPTVSKYRHRSWVGMFQHWEAKQELDEAYDSKAAMSLDGIFSPVSFFPTLGNTTFAMLPYIGGMCPLCDGKRYIEDNIGVNNAIRTYACPGCSRGMPDYVVNTTKQSGVNALNLQPVVVPYPVYRNAHAQSPASGERQRHSIRVIGRNSMPPYGGKYGLSLDTDKNKEILINPDTGAITESGDGVNPDFFIADIARAYDNGGFYPNNHRFFALRGPLMMHGWGYDISGYPVPNAGWQPKELDDQGRPKRFFLTISGTNDLTRDGAFLPTATSPLGDVIGQGFKKQGGNWVYTPSEHFYLNWAERPDMWPVGPIDLRWDPTRRVWTGGGESCNNADPPYIIAMGNDTSLLAQFMSTSSNQNKKCSYKFVYGVLEQNLSKIEGSLETIPARAFLDDLEYGLNPLPSNVRRLIYIVDRTGYTAPRGAKILLRYNVETGFYEPITKQQYMVFGRITGSSAVLNLEYMPGYRSGDSTYKITVNFKNPLGITPRTASASQASTGMFMYDNQDWILINTQSN